VSATAEAYRVGFAAPGHAPSIRELDGLSASTARLLGDDLEAADRCCLVARDHGGEIVGYAAAIVRLGESHVIDVAVARRHRRRGVASALLDGLDRAARARGVSATTLEVAEDNLAALSLYRRRGFVVEGRRRAYYPEGKDALIMWCREDAAVEGD
jgi:ribosomal-protein-alanine acetyltransferase